MDRRDELADNLARVRRRIDDARTDAGRSDEVTLIVVTKNFPASDVRLLAELGCTQVGENRDQEAREKAAEVADARLTWHMIGQLQGNKAKSVAHWADVVQSLDRASLLAPLASVDRSGRAPLRILIQVNIDDVPIEGRGGALPDQVTGLAEQVIATDGLTLAGVMGIAPPGGDARAAFDRLAQAHAKVLRLAPEAGMRSAGMSDDLEAAIAAGATHVRVGGAILGKRPYLQ